MSAQDRLDCSCPTAPIFRALSGEWRIRPLPPDSFPIEIETISGQRAGQTASRHRLGDGKCPFGHRQRGRANRLRKWLRTEVKDMAATTIGDWKEWKNPRGAGKLRIKP
jgi:hypothetical protein